LSFAGGEELRKPRHPHNGSSFKWWTIVKCTS
jgi:hypothetical protein